MAITLIGGGAVAKEDVVEMDDESAVESEAECEAFITLEGNTFECLLSYGDSEGSGGQTQRVGDEMWLLDTEASGYFIYVSTKLVGKAEWNITLRYAGSATYPIVGTGSL